MKKQLSMVVAAAMVAAALAGCGSSASDAGTENADTVTENADAGTAEDAGESADAGSGGTFKIGGIGPVTGAAAVYGQAVKNAAQLAVDEINAAGGINGAMIEFNFQDDEHDAEKAVNAYNTLKDWNMQMLLGTVTSTPCTAVVEKTHEDNLFQLTPSGSAVESIQYDNAFRVCFSDPNQGTASAQYIGENKLVIRELKSYLLKHLQRTAIQISPYSFRKQRTLGQSSYFCLSTIQRLPLSLDRLTRWDMRRSFSDAMAWTVSLQ